MEPDPYTLHKEKNSLKLKIEDYYGKKISRFEKFNVNESDDLVDGYVHEDIFPHRSFMSNYETAGNYHFNEIMFPFIRGKRGKTYIPLDAWIIEFCDGEKDVFVE